MLDNFNVSIAYSRSFRALEHDARVKTKDMWTRKVRTASSNVPDSLHRDIIEVDLGRPLCFDIPGIGRVFLRDGAFGGSFRETRRF